MLSHPFVWLTPPSRDSPFIRSPDPMVPGILGNEKRAGRGSITQLVLTYYLVKVSALVVKQEQLYAEAAAAGGMR